VYVSVTDGEVIATNAPVGVFLAGSSHDRQRERRPRFLSTDPGCSSCRGQLRKRASSVLVRQSTGQALECVCGARRY